MFTFVEYDSNIKYRELDCTPGLFHEALKYVLRGESRFHVHNEGAADFDMCYDDNDRYTKADPACPDSDFYKSELFFPPYYFYDETDLEKIYTLRELGAYPYVMIYDKQSLPKGHELRKLQRWVNNRFVWEAVHTFDEYKENFNKEKEANAG